MRPDARVTFAEIRMTVPNPFKTPPAAMAEPIVYGRFTLGTA